MSNKPAAKILRDIGIVMLSLIVTLGVAEGLLWLKHANQGNYTIEMWRYAKLLKKPSADPVLGHEHQANRAAKLQNILIRINGHGLRGPQVLAGKDNPRILLLGSSNTLGWGVEEEDTLPALLQKELGNKVEVLNGGIGNYNATRYVRLFEAHLRSLKPDLVIVHYFINDVEILEPGGGNWFLRNSQLAVLLNQVVRLAGMGQSKNHGLIEYYKNAYQDDFKGYREMVAALERLNEMSKQDGFQVIMAATPESHFLKEFPYAQEHAKLQRLAQTLGWDFVDLTAALQAVPQEQLWVMPSDPHYNALGHEIMAGAMLPAVKKNLSSMKGR